MKLCNKNYSYLVEIGCQPFNLPGAPCFGWGSWLGFWKSLVFLYSIERGVVFSSTPPSDESEEYSSSDMILMSTVMCMKWLSVDSVILRHKWLLQRSYLLTDLDWALAMTFSCMTLQPTNGTLNEMILDVASCCFMDLSKARRGNWLPELIAYIYWGTLLN